MKRLLLIACLGLLIASCAKSKAKKNIVGTWYETKVGSEEVPAGAQDQLIIGKIKGGEGEMKIIDASGALEPIEYKYDLEDGGEKLVIQTLSGVANVKSSRVILELTESTMRIDWGSTAYIGTYSK